MGRCRLLAVATLGLLIVSLQEGNLVVNGFSTINRSSSLRRSFVASSLGAWREPEEDVASSLAADSGPVWERRGVERVDKFARLPVWPAWNGVLIFLVSRLFGNEAASRVEDAIGGRVCPNFFDATLCDPFIMLVHHRHSFSWWDPLRYLQRALILPEGFPAHPHRGFVTVTYFLKGGFLHRDSLGVEQTYGARHNGKHTQWLTTGAGILHEEMFDGDGDHELYQLWLNLPSADKMMAPSVHLLDAPIVENDGSETVVIAGSHGGYTAAAPARSPVAILHVRMKRQGAVWTHDVPHETAVLYVRQGTLRIGDGTVVPPHHTAYLTRSGTSLIVTAQDADADFLLLTGTPLREPVYAQGSMVMNTPEGIDQAYDDYQRGRMGLPWPHTYTHQQWQQHITKHPSAYKSE